MKLRLVSISLVLGFLAASSAQAASGTWTGGGSDGNWSNTANWSGGIVPGATSGSSNTDAVTFNAAIANTWGNSAANPIVIDAGRNIRFITATTSAGNFVIGSGTGPALQLTSSGTFLMAGSGANRMMTLNAPLVLNGNYTFSNQVNQTTSQMHFGGNISGGTSGSIALNILQVGGGNSGGGSLGGVISDGSATTLSLTFGGGPFSFASSGTWTISGNNTYSGSTAITGPVRISSLNSVGSSQPSSLGMPQTAANGVITMGNGFTPGALIYTGTDTVTDRGLSFNLRATEGAVLDQSGTGLLKFTGTFSVANNLFSLLTLRGSTSGTGEIASSIPNSPYAGGSGLNLTKAGSGVWILSGSNSFTGTTSVSQGTLRLSNNLALQNSVLSTSGSGSLGLTVTAPTFGGLTGSTALASFVAAGYQNVTSLTLNIGITGAGNGAAADYSYFGSLADGAAGMTVTKTGTGAQTLGGVNSYTGNTTVSSGTLRLGISGSSLPGNIANAASLELFQVGGAAGVVGGLISGTGVLTKTGTGVLQLTNASSTYSGRTTIAEGTLEVASIRNVNGGASALGAATTAGNGTIDLGSTTASSATLRYTGTGHSSDRILNLTGTSNVTIDAVGSGPLMLTGTNTDAGSGTRILTLSATGTSVNQIGPIAGTGVSVTKTGPGTWQLTGPSSYSGRLAVSDGTVAVAWSSSGNNTPFGANTGTSGLPLIGSSSVTATGTSALLVQSGTVTRGMLVAESNGSQVVAIGGVGTGTAVFDTSAIRLGRSVTLQASTGGAVEFNSQWLDFNSGTSPAVAFNVGSADNAGTVVLKSFVPDSINGMNVRRGTLSLSYDQGATLGYGTPVTLGEAGASGTLVVNTFDQPLASLSFTGVDSTATTTGGSVLRLFNNGTSSASVAASGTGHVLSASTALDDNATFTVATHGRLLVSGPIGTGSNGSKTLKKSGPGILELSAANTYSGATIISQGTLALGAAGSFANSPTITVGDAGSSGAVLDLTAKSGGFSFGSGQTLKGGGTAKQLSSGTLSVAGLFSPGNSPGLFTYDGGTTLLSGTTLMEIWGTSRATSASHGSGFYDAVNVVNGGILNFGGTLELTFSQLFDTDTSFSLFSVLDSASLAGNFSGVNVSGSFYTGLLWSKPSGNLWKSSETAGGQSLEFNATTGTLVIVVPEPGAIALATIGIAALVLSLQRRQRKADEDKIAD